MTMCLLYLDHGWFSTQSNNLLVGMVLQHKLKISIAQPQVTQFLQAEIMT